MRYARELLAVETNKNNIDSVNSNKNPLINVLVG